MSISKTLKMDLPALAEMLRSKGRGKDTMLAHITPREAALLKRRGGSGTINPDTGLPEFDDGFDASSFDMGFGPGQYTPQPAPADIQGTTFTPQESAMYGYSEPSAAPQAPQAPVAQPSTDTTGGYSFQATRPETTGGDFSFSAAPQQQQFGAITPPTNIPPNLSLGDNLAAPGLGAGAGQEALRTAQLEGPAPTPKDTGILASLGKLGTPEALARLGLAGGLGVFGASQARKGAAQTQAATAEQQALAQPYQQQGQQLLGQAQRGELSPQSQQAYQAAQAQINQGIANRGGVGTQQAANQMANLYQTLLNNQYTYGLQISQIGDNIALGAIKTGLQLDQSMQQATTNFYTQLASLAAGGSIGGQTIRISQ